MTRFGFTKIYLMELSLDDVDLLEDLVLSYLEEDAVDIGEEDEQLGQ